VADFETKLRWLSERGDPVGAEELIERIEADLARDPLVVVNKRREGTLMTKTQQRPTTSRPGRYRGPAWAAAAFVAVLAVAGLYFAFSGDSDEVAHTSPTPTTVAPDVETLISPRLAYELEGDIYLADWDGGNAVRVADSGSDKDGSQCGSDAGGEGTMWAPDGRHFAYRSQGGDPCLGEVHVRDAQGLLVASVPGAGWDIGWSPDSTRFATWVELFKTIGIYSLDGERRALLTLTPGCTPSGDIDPLWSPDGKSVLVSPCEVPIDGGAPLRTPAPRSLVRSTGWQVSWSPDGTRVAYVTSTGDGETYDSSLVIAEASGTVLQVFHEESAPSPYYWYFVWSPSGDRVLFTWDPRTEDGGAFDAAQELRQLDVGSGQATTIAAEPGIRAIRFSPDGDRILFTTFDSSNYTGLWSMNTDGSDMQLLVPDTGFGDWQPHPGGD
jgi:Tol biopolymer transport system component